VGVVIFSASPEVSVIMPVKAGLMVRPSTGLNCGVSVLSSTVSDQFLPSLIAPDTVTVKAVAPECGRRSEGKKAGESS